MDIKLEKCFNETVDNCLEALKFIPDWFITSKMIEKFYDALLADDDTLFLDEDFSKVTYVC